MTERGLQLGERGDGRRLITWKAVLLFSPASWIEGMRGQQQRIWPGGGKEREGGEVSMSALWRVPRLGETGC